MKIQTKFQQKIFVFLLLTWLFLQLITLDKVPLPWFDEVFFKSLSDNLWQKGTFHVPIAVFEEEIKIYGFFYFICVGVFQSILGDSIFSFRLCNFLAGLCVLYWFWQKNKNNSFKEIWLFIVLLDPFFNLCLHEGRMDLMATFLLLLTFDRFSKPTYRNIIIGSFLGVLALLTTPRSAFAGFGLGFLLIFSTYFSEKSIQITLKKSFLSIFITIGLYFIWIWIGFGTFSNFVQSYVGIGAVVNKESSLASWFVGGSLYIPKHQYLLLFSLFFVFFLVIFFVIFSFFSSHLSLQKVEITRKIYIFTFFIFIFSFHIFVKDYGQYSIFIWVFYYVLLIFFLEILNKKYLHYAFLGILLSFNLVYFLLKNVQIFLTYPNKNMTIAREFIQKNIPKNSKVIGESMYMYAVTQAGSKFQLFEIYNSLEEREKKHREIFKYQYLIITNQSQKKHKKIIDYYFSKNKKLVKKAILNIEIDSFSKKIIKILPLSQNENEGYNAVIYEVMKDK